MKSKSFMVLLLVSVVLLSACSGGAGGSSEQAKLDSFFLEKAHEAVKEAFGEDYLPSMVIESQMIADIYGVSLDDVDAMIAEGPMMSVHVDTFIGIRAKEGKGESVAKALEAYRKTLVENSLQYPMNMAKVNASTVYTVGDHVFFLMLGKMNDGGSQTEEQALEYEKAQVQIAIDAIEELLK